VNINSHLDMFTFPLKVSQYSKVCVRACVCVRVCVKSIWEDELQ